jgi:hypothetical protein
LYAHKCIFFSLTTKKATPTKDMALLKILGSGTVLTLLLFQQVKNVSAYLRWIRVPALIPVPVNLPANARKPMSVRATPLANFGMGVAEAPIRAKMGGCHHATGGQL